MGGPVTWPRAHCGNCDKATAVVVVARNWRRESRGLVIGDAMARISSHAPNHRNRHAIGVCLFLPRQKFLRPLTNSAAAGLDSRFLESCGFDSEKTLPDRSG